MRSMYGPERILLASKKSHIKELIMRANDLTEAEIRSLPEKPDVIKGLLNIRRNANQIDACRRAEAIADAMMLANGQRI